MSTPTVDVMSRQIAEVIRRLDEQDKKYDARRKEDDRREETASRTRSELLSRVDAHGQRTTKLETKWEAFFGDQGAFKLFCGQIAGHDRKIDNLRTYVLIGLGLVLAAQFFVPMLLKGK